MQYSVFSRDMLLQFFVRQSILFPFVLCRSSKNREQEKDKHADVSAIFHRAFFIFFRGNKYALNMLSIDYYSFFNIKSS